MPDELPYHCGGCQRAMRAPRAKLLAMLAARRACLFCGGALVYPEQLAEQLEERQVVGGHDLRKVVGWSCAGCRRTFQRPLGELVQALASARFGRTSCPVCSGPYTFPPEVHEAYAELQARGVLPREADRDCPFCLREAVPRTADPDELLACAYCGAAFRAGLAGQGWRAPASTAAAAPLEEVQRAITRLPLDEIGTLAREALLARAARGEVEAGEAERLSAIHAGLAAWRPDGDEAGPFLPLPAEEAQVVLPALLFPGLVARPGRAPDGTTEVVLTTDRGTKIASVRPTLEGLTELATHLAAHAAGLGIVLRAKDPLKVETREVVERLKIALSEARGGVTLRLHRQVDDGVPQPLSEAEHKAVGAALAAAAPLMRRYYALLALYGPVARGRPALAALPAAISRRLSALGGPLSPAADQRAEGLHLRVRPAGLTHATA